MALKTNLQKYRKAAGFKNAPAFAEHIGISPFTYRNYEQGKNDIPTELLVFFADFFAISLDDLVGRRFVGGKVVYDDPQQKELNDYYESMNDEGRSALTDTARIMSGNPEMLIKKDRPEAVRVSAEVEQIA